MNAKTQGASRRWMGTGAPALRLAGVAARLSLEDRVAVIAIAVQFALMVAVSVVLLAALRSHLRLRRVLPRLERDRARRSESDATGLDDALHPEPRRAHHAALLAPLYWLMPSALGLRLIQDFSALGCSIVAYLWIRDLVAAGSVRLRVPARVLALTGLALIVLNPWPAWSNAFRLSLGKRPARSSRSPRALCVFTQGR